MADDAELPYLRGVAHVRSYAGAVIVIAHSDDAQCLRRTFRQFAQVHYRCGLFPAHIFYCHRQRSCDDLAKAAEGNKAAAARARKSTLELEKLGKAFRKQSIAEL